MSRLLVLLFSALVAGAALFGVPSPAAAVENPEYTSPPPSVAVQSRTPSVRVAATASKASSPSRQRLAITGAESAQMASVGGLLVASGAATLVIRRRLT